MAGTVAAVAEILNEVKRLYKTAQFNKNTTKILIERISVAFSVISTLQYGDWGLVQVLQDIEEYIEGITQYNTVQNFLKHRIIEKKFKDLRKEYDTSINLYSVEYKKFNAREEDKVLKKDIGELIKFQTASTKNTIVQILHEVMKLNKTDQHNENMIEILLKRISAAVSILQEGDDLFTSDYYTSHINLHRLVQILQNMKEYIEEITQYDTKKKFSEAKTIEQKFKDLRKEYDNTNISLLNFVDFEEFNAQEEDNVLLKFKISSAESMIVEILNEVTELYKTAQHNKNATKAWIERISEAYSAVNTLQTKDYNNLQGLVQVLQDIKKYIEEITQYNTLQGFLEAKTIEQEFKDLRNKYDNSISLLNINFKKFSSAQEDDKVLKEDAEKLLKFQSALVESMTDTNIDQISAAATAIYSELFVPLIRNIAVILSKVADLHRKAKHNKKIIKILIERIAVANSAVLLLREDDLYTLKDRANLERLIQVLGKIRSYSEKIAQYDTSIKLINSIEPQFMELCKEYDTSVSLLNLTLMVDFNAEKERNILKEEIKELSKLQATLAGNMNDVKQVTNVNDNMNLVVKQVSEIAMVMQNLIIKDTDQTKIDNVFHESPLPFENYKETDDNPRSDRLRKYVNMKTKEFVAFKTIKNEHINQVKNQVTILKKLEYCQNIIHFYGYTHDKNSDKYYLITEWAENGNLREYISRHGQTIEIKFRLRFAYDIAKGLNFLNAVKILHQDIRSENIVITDRDVAKITNFNTGNQVVNNECIRYKAPEMLTKGEEVGKSDEAKYDTKCEVYSFGILLWEIAEFRTPYEKLSFEEITNKVISGYRELFTEDIVITEKYQNLVNESVNQNPDLRPTFTKILIDLQDIFTIEQEELSWMKYAIKEKLIEYIEWNELFNSSKAGSGRFGSVSKAYWSRINNYVVFKKLIISGDIQGDEMNALKHEIQMQHRAHSCENVIRFFGITQASQEDHYCIVMEYADDGDLRAYLDKNFKSLDWNKKYKLALDIANGVHYLHKSNIIHRDLHAKNIVIQKGIAKITDFGLAKSMETQTMVHDKKKIFGMAPYVAPELLNPTYNASFSKKTDVYSLGVLLWEISSGIPPFKTYESDNLLVMNICQGKREEVIPDTPTDYHKLYTDCWNKDPEKRPIIEDVYSKLKCMLPENNETTENNVGTEDSGGSCSTLINQTQYLEYTGSLKFTFDNSQSNDKA